MLLVFSFVMEARASMKGQQQPPGKPPTDRPLSRLERFLLLAPRGAEVPGSQSSSGATASRKASSKGAAVSTVKDARAVCLGEEEVTLEDLAAADTLAENVVLGMSLLASYVQVFDF